MVGFDGLTLSLILGKAFAPLAWVIGVDWADANAVGAMLGTKIAVNEFLAFLELAGAADTMSDRSYAIATYALCGFANFSSIAIQLGGIGGIAPERRAVHRAHAQRAALQRDGEGRAAARASAGGERRNGDDL